MTSTTHCSGRENAQVGGCGCRCTFVPHLLDPRPTRWPAWPALMSPDALNEIDRETPFLVTDCAEVARRFDAFTQALPAVRPYFALKCNAARPVLATLA